MPSDTRALAVPLSFGLVVIGDEVLNGPRSDRHFDHFKSLLRPRGHDLAWFRLLPDDPRVLTDELGNSMSRDDPVFVCGGIGATPDDHTRACAAAAAGVPLVRNPRAKRAVRVLGVPESRLIPVMRRVGPRYPGLKLFSLPKMGEDAHILLGFRGRVGLDEATDALCRELDAEGATWEWPAS